MNDTAPIVSVCIANYNGMAVIDDCLQSVMEQVGDITLEILVHDDASNDGSVAYIQDRYPDVKLMVSEKNVGFCVANNRMAAQAKGKYLLLLNNDAALFPDALQTLIEEANRLEQPAILSLPQFDAASGELVDRGCLLDPFFNPVPNLDPNRHDVAMVIGACLWIPKALWNELGGFPEWFGSIAEDMYLCCRARLAGYAVRALVVSGYRHWQGKSFGGNRINRGHLDTTYKRRALSERNKTFVIVLICPRPFMQMMLPVHLVILLVEGLLLSLLKWQAAYLRQIYGPVFLALFHQRKTLLASRAVIMQTHRLASTDFFTVFVLLPHKLRMLLKHGMPRVR